MKSLQSQPESPEKADKERHKLRWIREHKLREFTIVAISMGPGFPEIRAWAPECVCVHFSRKRT